jgi:hypothetical protein
VNVDFDPFMKLESNSAINYMYNQILFMVLVVLTFFFIVEEGDLHLPLYVIAPLIGIECKCAFAPLVLLL